MKKIDEEKIKSWEELNTVISKMYLKLVELEKENNKGEEYNTILYLLPTALRLEKKRFLDMGLNKSNYKELEKRFNITDEELTDVTDGKDSLFSKLRANNYFTSMLNFHYDRFWEACENIGLFEYINSYNEKENLQNQKYAELYQSELTVNFIPMLDEYIESVDDEDVRNYLIYIKYLMIGTITKYESDYALLGCHTLPTRNMLTVFPTVEGYSKDEIDMLVKTSLKKDFLNEIEMLSKMNNFILPYHKRVIYKELALNKARLISQCSEEFINEMKEEVDKFLKRGEPFYKDINSLIIELFDDAYSIIKKDQTKKSLKH